MPKPTPISRAVRSKPRSARGPASSHNRWRAALPSSRRSQKSPPGMSSARCRGRRDGAAGASRRHASNSGMTARSACTTVSSSAATRRRARARRVQPRVSRAFPLCQPVFGPTVEDKQPPSTMLPPLDLPEGVLLLITDELASPADFLLHKCLLINSKEVQDGKIIVLSVSEGFTKWKTIASRLVIPKLV